MIKKLTPLKFLTQEKITQSR